VQKLSRNAGINYGVDNVFYIKCAGADFHGLPINEALIFDMKDFSLKTLKGAMLQKRHGSLAAKELKDNTVLICGGGGADNVLCEIYLNK